MKTSAIPENVKGNTITQEIIRIMSNTSTCITQDRRDQRLQEYFKSLIKSGYSWVDIERYTTPD